MLKKIWLALLFVICVYTPIHAQDEDPYPPGTISLSPEAEQVYEEMMASFDMSEDELTSFSEVFSNCSAFIGLRTMFTLPNVEVPETVQIESVTTETFTGKWFIPENADPEKVLLYLHGGAFLFGSVDSYTPFLMWLAEETDYQVFAIDYRLAPEHPFPAALDDTETSYRWLIDQGYTPENIAVAGDSAGGNLVATLLLRLRDADEPMPGAAWLYAAVLDFTRSSASENTDAIAMNSLLDSVANWSECYLGGVATNDPRVSPIFADLTGLPPLYITVGTREGGLGGSSRFARIARQSGVDVTLDVWDGMWHVWSVERPLLPESIMLHQNVGQWFDTVMGN